MEELIKAYNQLNKYLELFEVNDTDPSILDMKFYCEYLDEFIAAASKYFGIEHINYYEAKGKTLELIEKL